MKQSAKLQLFNYLYEQFSDLDVPVIETKDLNQELSYPFIAIQTVSDDVNVKLLTALLVIQQLRCIFGVLMRIKVLTTLYI